MKLDIKVTRAIRILKLVDLEGTVNAESLAKSMFMSPRMINTLCNKMVTAKYLISRRGPKGGYSIGKVATLYGLVKVFDPESVGPYFSPHQDPATLHLNKIRCDLLAVADQVFVL